MYGLLFATTVIEATSALALGLLASAAVSNAAQAALALPMLCFPQVLFGGAIVPVDQMTTPGRLMSLVLSNRHAFDALGRDLNLERYTATLPAMSAYRDTFHGGTGAPASSRSPRSQLFSRWPRCGCWTGGRRRAQPGDETCRDNTYFDLCMVLTVTHDGHTLSGNCPRGGRHDRRHRSRKRFRR